MSSKIALSFTSALIISIMAFGANVMAASEYITKGQKEIKLPAPVKSGGMSLTEALSKRSTARKFSSKPLTLQTISNLLWSASGINRADGKMTAPTTLNWQEIDIYLATSEGVYRYERKNNTLKLVLEENIMKQTGTQPYVGSASLELIYVADLSKPRAKNMLNIPEAAIQEYSRVDTGFIAQNVYLFCAANDLNTVVRGSVPFKKLHATLRLNNDQKITFCQTVGHKPKN